MKSVQLSLKGARIKEYSNNMYILYFLNSLPSVKNIIQKYSVCNKHPYHTACYKLPCNSKIYYMKLSKNLSPLIYNKV
jgi:hypothetical protein